MPRRLFTILPLLLGVAVCVLWVRSYSVMDTLAHWRRDVDWFDPRGVFTRADVWFAHSWKGALAVGRYRSFDRAIVGGPDGWVYQAHRDPKGSLTGGKWQYKAEQQQMDDDILKAYLDKQGKDHWELVAVEQMPVEPATPAVAGKPDPAKPRVMLFLRKPT